MSSVPCFFNGSPLPIPVQDGLSDGMEGLLLKHISHDTQPYLTQIKFDISCCAIPPCLEMDYMIQFMLLRNIKISIMNTFLLIL